MKNSLTILFLVMAVFAYAQRQNISGKVTDSSGGVLPGVTVVVKGTSTGTITDRNGTYSLQAAANARTLLFSFVGMETQEVDIAGRSVIDILLTEESVELEEVVAVGYGTMRKSDITGSVASVRADELSRAGTIGIDQSLAGKAAGVLVTQSSGVPGSGSFVKIRGVSSMQGSDPLYVIDGVPVDNSALSSIAGIEGGGRLSPLSAINAADIESLEILKDASATAIYGSRGANGVVLITTKSGKSGEGKIEIDAEYGIAAIPKFIDLQDANEYILTRYEARFNANQDLSAYRTTELDSARAGLLTGTNWQKAIYRQGKSQNYNLNLSGGNKDVRYLISSNFFDASGIVPKSDFTRISTRANLDGKLNHYLDFGSRLFFASIQSTEGINFLLYRFADALLIYAEAANEVAPATAGDAAYQAINRLRSRAGLANLATGLSQDDFRKAVWHERRCELAGECKRRFDLIRTKRLTTETAQIDLQWMPSDNPPYAVSYRNAIVLHGTVPFPDHEWLMPIPGTEMKLNEDNNWVQNEGYK